ncbi:MAG: GNAT family N-acetyltransferase [Polyangiaceae bacterium]
MKVRALDHEDTPACVALGHTVGWDFSEADWSWMASLGHGYGVALAPLELVGAAIVFDFGAELAMVAMLMVRPDHQRRGVGRALLSRVLEDRAGPTALYASEAGERLYRPMGFADAAASVRYEGAPICEEPVERRGLRPATSDDLASIIALDAEAQGANRGRLLTSLFDRRESSWVLEDVAGRLSGFGIATLDKGFRRLGPLVAEHDEDATALADALTLHDGVPIRLDLEPGEIALERWAESADLTRGEVSPRLVHHGSSPRERMPGLRYKIRALAGRPFG